MKVLLAADGSECSEEAARFLSRLPFSPSDEIIVLHVLSAIPYDDDYTVKVNRLIRVVAPRIIRGALKVLQPVRARITTLEVEGYPDTAIIETAVEQDVDIVAMGARGVRGVRLLIIGSVTRSVGINSPKPTLVVKHHERKSGEMQVLLAVDGSPCAEAAARVLTQMPFPPDTGLTVLNITQTAVTDIPEKYLADLSESEKARIPEAKPALRSDHEAIFRKTMAIVGERFPKPRFITKVGNPSIEILDASKNIDADLIAVGSRGLRGLKGMLGSVSRNVVAFSHCSVLIGKAC